MGSATLSRLTLRSSGNGMPLRETSLVQSLSSVSSSAAFGRN